MSLSGKNKTEYEKPDKNGKEYMFPYLYDISVFIQITSRRII
jgi:hypothetical protein